MSRLGVISWLIICAAALAAVTTGARPADANQTASADRPLGILIENPTNPFLRPAATPAKTSASQSTAHPDAPKPGVIRQRTAKSRNGETGQSDGAKPEIPVRLLADEMSFDREKNVVSASGNVEISFGDRTLLADTIEYNQSTDIVVAAGNVTVLEATGETLFADRIVLTGDFRDGLVRNIGVILADKSRLAAHGAKRSGGVITELRQGVYSPCNLCAENPDRAPMWQIRAVRVIHDQRSQLIEYRDAWLEVFGLPVLYAPYFAHPDPSGRRKAGFLAPGFGGSSDLGFVARLPYFYPIDDHSDVTVTPTIIEQEGLLLKLQHRERLKHGKLDTELSAINDSEDDFRGHIFSEGRFDINNTWRAGFDLKRATDDTYLRRFGFDSPAVLQSRAYAEAFRERNYFSVSGYLFQDLRTESDAVNSPTVLPLMEFSRVGEPDRFGGSFSLEANLLAITRDSSGNDTRRLSVRPSWNRRFTDTIGSLINFSTGVYADSYHVTDVARADGSEFSGVTGRVHPYAALEWRYPLVRNSGHATQALEPVVQIITSPNGGNPSAIPNEDSQELEFDETNLFQLNRFGGIDRIEGGTRVNYGVKWGLLGSTSGEATFFVGQTYRLSKDDTFADGSGLEDRLSDIVASVRIHPFDQLDLAYRTQIDKDKATARRHELSVAAGVPLLTANGRYSFFEQQEGSEFASREELTLGITSKITRNWGTNVYMIRDLTANEMRSLTSGLTYENECVVVTSRFSRTFYSDRDLQPADAFTISVLLKTLGQATF
ncbi:MAG: LPS assembly protein LptD [Rhodospirillaceae bacterium]